MMWLCGWPVLKWSTATQSSFVPRVLLHLHHQPAHERFEVGILVAVLGGHDDAELMTIVAAAFEERLAIGGIVVGRVKFAGLAFSGHAVTLDITQVRPRQRQGPFPRA